jgi:hypothetical protein
MLTKQFALNTEMAYKRNDGHATVNGSRKRLECLILRLSLRRQTLLLVPEYSKQLEGCGTSVFQRFHVTRQIQ